METPLHPTPMQRPMMKGRIYVDASYKPTFQGIWGMTHADVTKGGHTNDFKVVRMESIRPDEIGMPVFSGHYLGYFKLTANHQTETVNESFTLQFRGHTNQGYNVYGYGENRFGKTEIVGTVTQTGKMEIFKMLVGTTNQPDPDESAPPPPKPVNPRAVSPTPPLSVSSSGISPRGGGGKPKAMKSSGGGSSKKKSLKSSSKNVSTPPPSKNGLPGPVVKILKDCVQLLKKSDKGQVFHFPVPLNFRGPKGVYAEVIKKPMDLSTVMIQIDTKYRMAAECIEDLRLVFSNAKLFNPDTDPIHALAASLSGMFESFVSQNRAALRSNGSTAAGASMKQRDEQAPPAANESTGGSTSAAAVGPRASGGDVAGVSDVRSGAGEKKDADTEKVKQVEEPAPLSLEEQHKLAKDVNELFKIGNDNPLNERAQARVYALWSFTRAFVAEKDRVMVDSGKRIEIQVDAMNHMRQRQLKDVVSFFLESSKEDPKVEEQEATDEPGTTTKGDDSPIEEGRSDVGDANADEDEGYSPETKKRYRSDSSGSEEDDEERYPFKASRSDLEKSSESKSVTKNEKKSVEANDRSAARMRKDHAPSSSLLTRVDSSKLVLEAPVKLQEEDLDFDFDEEDDDEDEKANSEVDDGEVDVQWSQAQQEKREKEDREKKRAAAQQALEEQRMKIQAQRERERVEEGLKLSRERAAEKARQEAAAQEKERQKQKAIQEKMLAQRLIREQQKDTVDLDQVRGNSVLMNLMDASVYDD